MDTNVNCHIYSDPERRHYVYRHLRNDTGMPFYIGVGSKPPPDTPSYPSTEYARAYAKTDRSSFWKKVVKKCDYTVEILQDDLTLEEANNLEKWFISLYGRIDINTGILVNLTDGGEGTANFSTREETKQKLREANLKSVEKNLDEFLFPCPVTGCYHWAGMEVRGKAYICQEGKCYPAHKFLYEYWNKTKLKKGEFVTRSCGNQFCVNPQHFILTDYKGVNKKGKPRTYKHHRQSLTAETVLLARKIKAEEGVSNREISERLGCSYTAISQAIRGTSWGWLNG